MKINNYENIKTNFINENPKATNNQSLRPIYENHHLKPYFYNNRINQNNINENPSSINERVAQQLSNQNNNNNIPKILINQIDLTKASTKPDKSLDNNIIFNEFPLINETTFVSNYFKENSSQNCYEKLKQNLMPKKQFLNKKKKFELFHACHSKFSNDNLQRRCKTLVLDYCLEYLNNYIKLIYDGNIGNGICIKQLLDINQEQKADNTIDFNKKFLNKTLKEIYSTDISTRYTSFLPDHNKKLIKRLLNEKDENKRIKLNQIFNLTFSDCVNKFIGINNSEELDGFPTFEEIKSKLNESNIYLEEVKKFLMNFEKILNQKNPRTRKEKKINAENQKEEEEYKDYNKKK